MKTMLYTLLLLILVSLMSCKRLGLCKDEELTLVKTDYNGQELRTDGFYYGNPGTDFRGNDLYDLIVFYKNGIIMYPGTVELNRMEKYIVSIANINMPESKYDWGLFNINNKSILLEQWLAAQAGCHPTLFRSGEILNDSTFVLSKQIIRDPYSGTKETSINQEFHFRHFEVKPDSTNNFIK